MRAIMGVVKNRHGVYMARKKVPKGLEEAVARVLGSKDQTITEFAYDPQSASLVTRSRVPLGNLLWFGLVVTTTSEAQFPKELF